MNNKNMQDDIGAKRLQNLRNGLNTVSGGRYERLRNAPVVGSALKKAEDAASQKLKDNKSKSPSEKNQESPKKKENDELVNNQGNKTNDVAAQKLKNVNRTKRGNLNNLFRRNKKNQSNQTYSQEEKEDASDDDEETSDEEKNLLLRSRRIKIIISIISIVLPIFLIFFLIIMVMYILTSTVLKPVLSVTGYNEDSSKTSAYMINDRESKNYSVEMNYYRTLDEKAQEYKKKCNVNLNTNYIHASLVYLYYQIDYSVFMDNDKSIYIDYGKMTDMIDNVYDLMVNEESCEVDYDIDGEFYNKLLVNSSFRNYYKDLLKEEDMSEILDGIFELAESIDFEYDDSNNVFISPKLKVKYNGLDINAKDYLTGVIYNKLDKNEINNSEIVKAYTVLYTGNTIYNGNFSSDKLTISLNGNDYCDINSDCNGKGRITSSERNNIRKNIDSVYGNVVLNNNGGFVYLNENLVSGNDYKTILSKAYPNYQVKNLLENTYDVGTSYGNNRVLTKVYFYDQNDYANVKFCGRSNASIKSSGCGVTAMAIIVSTYQNSNKYDPVYEMNRAYNWGYCGKGISGTSVGFFKKEAKEMGYKYLKVSKSKVSDLNLVLSHLAKGDLVIAHMGPGHFTSGGHYMVLGGVDPETKKVYVYDPYNKSNKANKNRRTGNGWYSLNDMIAKEAFAFYIIWKG